MKSKKKLRKKRSLRRRGHPEPQESEVNDFTLGAEEEPDTDFLELTEPDDFDITPEQGDDSEW